MKRREFLIVGTLAIALACVPVALADDDPVSYRVLVTTGTLDGAGTNSDVYIRMKGEKGSSGDHLLSAGGGRDPFENGDEDAFDIECADLGKLKSIHIRTRARGRRPNWLLIRVVVIGPNNVETAFVANRWVGPQTSTSITLNRTSK